MANSTARLIGPSPCAPVAVCIKSVWRALPRPGFTSGAGRFQLRPHNPFDLNLGFVLASVREIVGHLERSPVFRAVAGRAETDPADAISSRR